MTPELRALASAIFSNDGVPEDMLAWACLKEHPTSATVWRVAAPGRAVIVKQHRHPRSFAQELQAYRDWLPRLSGPIQPAREARDMHGALDSPSVVPTGGALGLVPDAQARPAEAPGSHMSRGTSASTAGRDARTPPAARDSDMSPGTSSLSVPSGAPAVHARVPALLGFDGSARALVLTCVRGERMSLGTYDLDVTTSAHAAVGRLIRALHELPVDDGDPLPLLDAVTARLDAWHDRAGDVLTPAERDGLRRLASRREAFAAARRVPCHRDFTPDNWLLEGTGLYVLDFEHARLDVAEADLVKLRADVWAASPALEAAFLAGYGPLDGDARARLDVLLALHAVATLAWAERHADAAFRALGRRALELALGSS